MEQSIGVFHGPGDIRIEKASVSRAGPKAIVVKVLACGICGSDVHRYQGHTPTPSGSVLGHEFVGTIFEVGDGVRDLSVGERVIVNPMASELGQGGEYAGAFAEYVAVPNAARGETVFPLPDEMPTETAALIEPFAVGLHAVGRIHLKPGSKAVVFGAGTIGLCTALALRSQGVREILVTDLSETRLKLARRLGLAAVNVTGQDVRDLLIAHFGVAKVPYRDDCPAVDIVVDCAGSAKTFEEAIVSVRPGGQIVIVAAPLSPVEIWPIDILLRESSVVASYAYTRDDFLACLDLIQTDAVDLTPLVTHRFTLDELPEAFAVQSDPSASMKVMVNIAAAGAIGQLLQR